MNVIKARNKIISIYSYSIKKISQWNQPTGENTGIYIYNSVAKGKVPIILKDNIATWYSCGPTVYDSAHIGHASCYMKLDIIQRILMNYFNINLLTSMGITDVDDKIIKKSRLLQTDIKSITDTYEAEFWENLKDLGLLLPHVILRVSESIPIIIHFIKGIMDKKMCYITQDKSIYFDTGSYEHYGKLRAMQHNYTDDDNAFKKSSADFALWKAYKKGEPYWETDWGIGRPGWHIECSAMVSNLFGCCVDFHAGGIDLKFPHHENEEAQSCAFYNKEQWVNYWIHPGHLHLSNDTKMSKSLNNTISIKEMLQEYNSETFRMACLLSHYSHAMEFNREMMKNAQIIIEKLKFFFEDCNVHINTKIPLNSHSEEFLLKLFNETKTAIDNSLRDDFNTSDSIALILKLIKETKKILLIKEENGNLFESYKPNSVLLISQYLRKLFTTFGFNFDYFAVQEDSNQKEMVDLVVNFRNKIRTYALKTKDEFLLKECDGARDTLKKCGIKVNDKSNSESLWIKV